MYFNRDGIQFHFVDSGNGVPFVYQHGLGGDVSQPLGFVGEGINGVRVLSVDCRAHGDTRPVGPENKISIASFADDVVALLDERHVEAAIVGGISMGAAIALNIGLRYPQRVKALILQRPAWLDAPEPENLRPLMEIGALIKEHGAKTGAELFARSETYARMERESPDTAASALAQFTHPRTEEAVVRLLRIPGDAPCADRAWRQVQVPTLVIANRMDPIHPYAYAEVLANEIPGAIFREVTPKSVSIERHTMDVRTCLIEFLNEIVRNRNGN